MTPSRPLPRSIEISETLIREIASGLLPDGSRLPTERQMAADYGVAVGTLRKALAVLEEKGLLERVQGSGNYVRRRANVQSVYSQFRLEKLGGGGLPTAQIVDLMNTTSPESALAFGFSATALRIDRLRSLDGHPVALERIWLDGRYGASADASQMSESLYAFYRDHLGLVISRVEDSVGVSDLPAWAKLPGINAGDASGYIKRRAWSQSGEAAEYSQTWFDPARARFINRIEGLSVS